MDFLSLGGHTWFEPPFSNNDSVNGRLLAHFRSSL